MAQVSESRPTSSAQSNIQDVFLNSARRDRLAVAVRLMDGRQFEARIKNFDRFAVIVEVDGADLLLFKHAIATIETPRTLPTYLAANDEGLSGSA
jgi:host factor-I protein